MSKTPLEYNRHHCIPTSKGGLKEGPNCQIVIKRTHDAYHQLLENKTPAEAIQFVLKWNQSVLTKNFRHRVMGMIEDENMIYRDGVWIYK